jgi:hypothetical protein
VKRTFTESGLPNDAVLIVAQNDEERSSGIISLVQQYRPKAVLVLDYSKPADLLPLAMGNVTSLVKGLGGAHEICAVSGSADVATMKKLALVMQWCFRFRAPSILLDISVIPKEHLFFIWQLLDDYAFWARTSFLYTEPEGYIGAEDIPLSFGLSSFQQMLGFSAYADCSRPVRLVLLLGFEGDRAIAVYELVQPMETTVLIPSPPFREEWAGKNEALNRDLLSMVGSDSVVRVDPIDPAPTCEALRTLAENAVKEKGEALIICPLSTKPQALGVYAFLRESSDPPAIVSAQPKKISPFFRSVGVGRRWIIS